MRDTVKHIIHDKEPGSSWTPVMFPLRLLEIVYGFVMFIRNLLYDRNMLPVKDVPCRVVSIGNLTVGGTGKTPIAIMTAGMIRDAGYAVAVVSRGYTGTEKGPFVVSDGSSIRGDRTSVGDEPLIIAEALPDVPVVVGRDRHRAAQEAYERFRPRVIVLDDGFQHRRLSRTVDIVTMDAGAPIGNEHLLPRGPLRESPKALKRASAVVITRYYDELRRDAIERVVHYFSRTVRIYWSRHVPKQLRHPGSGETLDCSTVRGKKVAAMSNIVNHGSFHAMIAECGGEIVRTFEAPDHHAYTAGELDGIRDAAMSAGAAYLVMTAKDERNLPREYSFGGLEAVVLDVEVRLEGDQEDYLERITPRR